MDILALRELAHGGVAEEDGRVDSSEQCDAGESCLRRLVQSFTDCWDVRQLDLLVSCRSQCPRGKPGCAVLRVAAKGTTEIQSSGESPSDDEYYTQFE